MNQQRIPTYEAQNTQQQQNTSNTIENTNQAVSANRNQGIQYAESQNQTKAQSAQMAQGTPKYSQKTSNQQKVQTNYNGVRGSNGGGAQNG